MQLVKIKQIFLNTSVKPSGTLCHLFLPTNSTKLCLGLVSINWFSNFSWQAKPKSTVFLYMHLEMYQLHTIFSTVSSHMFIHTCTYVNSFLNFTLLGFLFYQFVLSVFKKRHFTLQPVCHYYLPREEPQLSLAGYEKLFRISTMPKVWRICLTRTAEGNLHV